MSNINITLIENSGANDGAYVEGDVIRLQDWLGTIGATGTAEFYFADNPQYNNMQQFAQLPAGDYASALSTPLELPIDSFLAQYSQIHIKVVFDIDNVGTQEDIGHFDAEAGGATAPNPGAPGQGAQGADNSSLPSPYGQMGALMSRMKVDTTQIKHRLHTADYDSGNGGYKPSQPASESALADYKAYPADGMITGLRQAAYGDPANGVAGDDTLKTIPYVLNLDQIEARLASLSDADLSVAFDQASPVWRAHSDADADGSNRIALKALGDMDVANRMVVGLEADVSGNMSVAGAADIADDVTVGGMIDVAGSAIIGGDLDAQAALQVAGVAAIAGDVTMAADLDVSGSVDIEGSLDVKDALTVEGTSTFEGDVTANGDLTIDNMLDVDGSADFDVTDFSVDATGEIRLESDASGANPAILIKAAAGIVKIEGADGVNIKGQTTFEDDLLIKDTLILEGDANDEPDFIIKDTNGLKLIDFDGSAGGMSANITGDLTVGGSLVVVDALEVGGQMLQADATVTTFGDNIIEINKANAGSHKSVGVKLDGASSERDFFFGINKDSAKFVFSKEKETPDVDSTQSWEDAGMSEDKLSDLTFDSHVDAAEIHAGHARLEGIATVKSDMKVGAVGSEILKVEAAGTKIDGTAGAVVTVSGDAVVEESLKVDGGLLDVDGDADIEGGLIVEGLFKADNDGTDYTMVVDHGAAGLTGDAPTTIEKDLGGSATSVDRLKLQNGVADIQLIGDMQLSTAVLDEVVIDGDLQAYGFVGLGASDKDVRVFGPLLAEMDAEFKESLRVSNDGQGNYGLVIDDAAQTAGLSIASRELAVGSDAMFTLASGKDMLLQGNLGVVDDAIFGGDIWFDGKLASRSEFIMQDAFTDGDQYNDKDNQPQNVFGFVLASDEMKSYDGVSRNKDVQELLLNTPAEVALVDLPTGAGGTNQKHISIMGVLSSLISGGSSVRVEHDVASSGVGVGVAIDVGTEIHDGSSSAEAKAKIKVFYNGQRLSEDDYSIGANKQEISFNFFCEEDDRFVIDVADSNPGA